MPRAGDDRGVAALRPVGEDFFNGGDLRGALALAEGNLHRVQRQIAQKRFNAGAVRGGIEGENRDHASKW